MKQQNIRHVLLLFLILIMVLTSLPALAQMPYKTFTLGINGELVETQTAYEPVRSMTRFGEETLKDPQDLRMGKDGNLYIADTGNKRILVVSREGELIQEIKDKKNFKTPSGVNVDAEGNIYVADESARAVLVYSPQGELIRTWNKPTHPLFGDTAPYKPRKVVIDKRGNLYICSKGNTNGIVQISPAGEGEFLGYYGANMSSVTLLTAIKKAVFSDEQLSSMAGIVPISVENICIDEKGMVYAVSQTSDERSLRRLNVAGRNTLVPDYWTELTSAVAVTQDGSVFTANANGRIVEYTSEGDMLFVFGAFDRGDQRVGTFKSVTGMVVDELDRLYVLDSVLCSIQVLEPTEFTSLVHEAFHLFQDGKYAQSKAPWSQVQRMNSLFTYANTGMGEALYREGDFEESLTNFRNSGNRQGYSDAYWEMRSNWLHSNVGTILVVLVALIVLIQVLKAVNRKTGFMKPLSSLRERFTSLRLISQTGWTFQMLKNPYDCCYGIKHEGRASYVSAVIMLIVFFALSVISKYFSGFLFKTVQEGQFEVLSDFINFFSVFLLLVICCYLVCTIKDGEARFRDLFIGSAYALAPMIVFLPVRILFTNVLTYNEAFFITLLDVISYGWTGLLILLMLMYLNDYSFRRTLSIVILTLFTVLVTVALLFVIYVLIIQLANFISGIYGEVVYRFVRRT
ncbi:MAG: hypothetical protein IJ083_06315 [Clostridia bacterium]|nr:hypothetical protein [Clostridia bacterium]